MHLQSLRIFIISLNANYRIAHLMPSRADDSFLRTLQNLRLLRFPEPVLASICQNILTDPHFRACLQFGHI